MPRRRLYPGEKKGAVATLNDSVFSKTPVVVLVQKITCIIALALGFGLRFKGVRRTTAGEGIVWASYLGGLKV